MRQTTDKGKPALCPIIARAGAFFKTGKAQTMNKENMNTPENYNEDDCRALMLQAFDRAVSEDLNDDTKAEALTLARLYIGVPDMPESSPLFGLMSGFLMGVKAGMDIAAAIDSTATV